MPQGTADLYGAIEPVTRKHFGLELEAEKPQFSQIAETDSSDEPIKDVVQFGGPGQLSYKAENAAMQIGRIVQGPIKRWSAATYAGAIELSREVVKDVKYALVKKAAGSLGRGARLTPEYLWAQFMDRSFDSSFPATPDNKELCSTSHVNPDGTTFSNALATPAALAETSLEDLLTQLRTVTGPDGMLSPEMAKAIIVPAALHNLALKLNRSEKTLGSPNNDPSVVKGTKVITFDYLTNTTRWFLQTKNSDGLFWTWREKTEFLRDNTALTLQAIFVAFFRAYWGAEDPRCIFASNAV